MRSALPQDAARLIDTGRLLVSRLERLSVDSYWAHRASGLRGSLLRWYEEYESAPDQGTGAESKEILHLRFLVEKGFDILEKAAREIRVPEKR